MSEAPANLDRLTSESRTQGGIALASCRPPLATLPEGHARERRQPARSIPSEQFVRGSLSNWDFYRSQLRVNGENGLRRKAGYSEQHPFVPKPRQQIHRMPGINGTEGVSGYAARARCAGDSVQLR